MKLRIASGGLTGTPFQKGQAAWNKKERPLKNELEFLYLNQQLSTVEIASIYKVTYGTIWNWLRYYGIPIRSASEASRIANAKPEFREKQSKTKKKAFMNNPTLLKRCLSSKKPNRDEKLLDLMIQTHLPNHWKYVGNGEVNLGGRCPDWININGKKKVIELFGAYWHDPFLNQNVSSGRTEVATRYHYSQYGFDCLVIWARELKKPRQILTKIKEFTQAFPG